MVHDVNIRNQKVANPSMYVLRAAIVRRMEAGHTPSLRTPAALPSRFYDVEAGRGHGLLHLGFCRGRVAGAGEREEGEFGDRGFEGGGWGGADRVAGVPAGVYWEGLSSRT